MSLQKDDRNLAVDRDQWYEDITPIVVRAEYNNDTRRGIRNFIWTLTRDHGIEHQEKVRTWTLTPTD